MGDLVFELVLLDEAERFIAALPKSARRKIYYNAKKVQSGFRDPELFTKLEGTNIWEFRTRYEGNTYRLFAFWDTQTSTLVIATHGLKKKTQKTPKKEIAKAIKIRDLYFESKKGKR